MAQLVRITLNIDGRDIHNIKGEISEDKRLPRGEEPVIWELYDSNITIGAKNINDILYRLMGITENFGDAPYEIRIRKHTE